MTDRKTWEVAYRRDRACGRTRYVPAEPARAVLQRLLAAHVPLRALARATGLSGAALHAIVSGAHPHVQRRTADRIAALTLPGLYAAQTHGHVPKIGAVRRLHALMAMGWSRADLDRAGAGNLGRVLNGPGDLVTIDTWRRIRDLYDTHSMTIGPSPTTMAHARARGYPPPLAWDEDAIDDPHATPAGLGRDPTRVLDTVAVDRATQQPGHAAPLTRPERLQVVRAMSTAGAPARQIAEHLDLSDRSVLRIQQRHAIPTPHAASPSPQR